MSRERLELTFGPKDADLWEYISAPGLPKASIVKNIIREHMNNKNKEQSVVPFFPQPVQQEVAEEEVIQQEEKTSKVKNSPFGGMSKKL